MFFLSLIVMFSRFVGNIKEKRKYHNKKKLWLFKCAAVHFAFDYL